ncbi:V-set and transmembrane domain-containing protein 4 [Microcaecilia unicolor]|uniref:V-set and transmembrane domain-containing protein 4 n=1 Tax=Microcaecilia unicolor TaxID=1415580 RepID=A0A6P7YCE7_9AMPH|nr:V-set and transmembrane domain-containing protein 4 [Microcaecilia unicolor]
MMHIFLVTLAFLSEALTADVCEGLNVTVSPGPAVQYMEGANATLFCHVSQKKRTENLLAVRWVLSLSTGQELLMIKMNKFGAVQYYGNYSRNKERVHLYQESMGASYKLLVLNLRRTDQGHYICKVQEIGKHKSKWTAWSNGTANTEVKVISYQASDESTSKNKNRTWWFFEDLYLYAALVCSIGIISVLLFTLIIVCQSMFSKRRSRVKHHLVKCPQNSSGETVTSVTSLSPLQPKKKKKLTTELPPAIPVKAPRANAPRVAHKPKLLKHHSGKVILPKITEESLTYAELELMKPPKLAKGVPTSTVYAQILFEENKM